MRTRGAGGGILMQEVSLDAPIISNQGMCKSEGQKILRKLQLNSERTRSSNTSRIPGTI